MPLKQSRGLDGPFIFTSASFAVYARIHAAGNMGCLLGGNSPHRRCELMPIRFLGWGQSQHALHHRKTVGGQHQILGRGRSKGESIVAQRQIPEHSEHEYCYDH